MRFVRRIEGGMQLWRRFEIRRTPPRGAVVGRETSLDAERVAGWWWWCWSGGCSRDTNPGARTGIDLDVLSPLSPSSFADCIPAVLRTPPSYSSFNCKSWPWAGSLPSISFLFSSVFTKWKHAQALARGYPSARMFPVFFTVCCVPRSSYRSADGPGTWFRVLLIFSFCCRFVSIPWRGFWEN